MGRKIKVQHPPPCWHSIAWGDTTKPSDWEVSTEVEFVPSYTARQIADGDDLEPEGPVKLGSLIEELMPKLILAQREAVFDIDVAKLKWFQGGGGDEANKTGRPA